MFFVDLPSPRKKNEDINPDSNNASNHIPKATVQLRYLTVTSISRYILFTADEKHGVGIIQNLWNGNLTPIPGTSKKSLNVSPLDRHMSHLKEGKKKTKTISVPLKSGNFTGSISPAMILLHFAN